MRPGLATIGLVASVAALLIVTGCGASAGHPSSSSPCTAASGGVRLTSLHGQGSGTTSAFTVCGGWSADLDWRCQTVAEVTTTAVGESRRQNGPFGDGLVGMNIVYFQSGGTYRFEVQASAGCTWNIDIDAGRV